MPSTPIMYRKIINHGLTALCLKFVQRFKGQLTAGIQIKWLFPEKGGRSGSCLALLTLGTQFYTTYYAPDWTQFYARLIALATALKAEGLLYMFFLKYKDDIITVQRVDQHNSHGSSASIKTCSAGSTICIEEPNTNNNDDWWKALSEVLKKANALGLPIGKLVFRGGGTTKIPDWFRDWCRENGIEIEILAPETYDPLYNVQTLHVDADLNVV